MRHSFLDKYAYQDTPIHRLDGRVKLIVFGVLIVAAATTPARAWWVLAGYGLVLCSLIVAASSATVYFALSCQAARRLPCSSSSRGGFSLSHSARF